MLREEHYITITEQIKRITMSASGSYFTMVRYVFILNFGLIITTKFDSLTVWQHCLLKAFTNFFNFFRQSFERCMHGFEPNFACISSLILSQSYVCTWALQPTIALSTLFLSEQNVLLRTRFWFYKASTSALLSSPS